MTYTYTLPLKAFIFFLLLTAVVTWVFLVIVCTPFQPGGGPISNDLKLYLLLPSIAIAFIIVRHHSYKYRTKIILDGSTFQAMYDKRRKKNDVHINAADITLFEIGYLNGEYDYCRIYIQTHEYVEFGRMVPHDDALNFCKNNNIIPLLLPVSMTVFAVLLKRKQLIIQYYGKKPIDIKIEAGNISHIDLEILHPISNSQNRYLLYTLSNERYEIEAYVIDREKLSAYALKHNFPLTEKKMY